MLRFRSWLIFTLCLVLVACGSAPTAPASEATPAPAATAGAAEPAPAATGGTIRIGRTANPDSLNPGAAYLAESFDIFELVYDALIDTDLRNQPVPQLAEDWSVADDNRTWTFTLHEGTVWHDGTPLTSADVKFTYDMIAGFDSFALLKDYTSLLESVETPDERTVIITFAEPVSNTDERFSSLYILPQHIWSQFTDATAASEFENTAMIGSGPFKLVEYQQDEFLRMEAVKDHYLTPPQIDEAIFRIFGNADAMVQALRTGEIDLIDVASNTVVRTLQADENIQVEVGNALSLNDIIFNVTEPENCPPDDGVCSGHPALRDVQVRQALAHATDKQQLIDVVLLGLGAPGLSLVMPGHGDGYAAQLADYAYDVARANQILEEAGYVDSDGDGIREMPGDPSMPLNFRYSFPSDQSADGTRFFELLRDMWREAGVEITLTPLDADALTSICCPAFDFDVINWGWGAGVDPASLLYILTTEQITTGVSETGYSNPEFDQLYTRQLVTVDRDERIAMLHQMQEIALRDVPYIIPWYAQNVEAYRTDRFTGWQIDSEGLLDLDDRSSLTVITPVQ
ncbi:MAG: ABC transporter substrate-binding protein [Oscillochloris sp.]|nr:ABC transporter substrate-binding protein [Oscillochloris sp.]